MWLILLSFLSLSKSETGNVPTSCEKFLTDRNFDSMEIIDVDWRIFYFWNSVDEQSFDLVFTIPYYSLIERFKKDLESIKNDLEENLDLVELSVQTTNGFTAFLIKTKKSGWYKMVPAHYHNTSAGVAQFPVMEIALKVVEPGYLGFMNCEYRTCYALAPSNNMPHPEEVEEAAATLNFWNPFGHSYLDALQDK